MATPADLALMRRALALAEQGLNTTTPNPRVGCVLERDGVVVGQGWHQRAGEPHAEVLALRSAGERARGATAYVTLEPCSHHGRTPPCADTLIEAGVVRVVSAMQDPNPLVAGRGIARLRAADIVVDEDVLVAEATELNRGFVSRMTRGRPWVRAKIAATLDGRTALASGESKWITGEAARADGHRWRARACAILTGSGTVRADDPQLTVRAIETPRAPRRVVVDSALATPPAAKVLAGGGTLIVCARAHEARARDLVAAGAEVLALPGVDGRVDLPALCATLAQRGVNELHVEAGRTLNGALLAAGLLDEVLLYLAPRIAGDGARGMFDLPALARLDQAVALEIVELHTLGADVCVRARVSHTASVA